MKYFAFLLVLVGLLSNVYSYIIDNKYYPNQYEIERTDYKKIGFPENEVVSGPNHYRNQEENVDVYGTVDQFMKKYYPSVEYKYTDATDKGDFVILQMVQLYHGIEIRNSSMAVYIDYKTGDILETNMTLVPNFVADDFEDRGNEIDEVKYMFEYINQYFYEGKLDLSGATFVPGTTSLITNVPFNGPVVVTKLYYDFYNISTYESSSRAVWEFEFHHGLYIIKIYIDDKSGELLYLSLNAKASDLETGHEIDFDQLIVTEMPEDSKPSTTTFTTATSTITTKVPPTKYFKDKFY
ncbi:hypothetical protein PIROE2DRAFT_63711 [Piromyces sp. E2]|nr:hypothetical protein PIROE2DRAFT_63711 [Piromyces sp. E2]|eukprot:OUM59538.1 hypothetical protein PIROE2DRAFT_63711 [Piromyces sp. E2]